MPHRDEVAGGLTVDEIQGGRDDVERSARWLAGR